MEIKVLGSGCARCSDVAERLREEVAALGVAASVMKVTDVREIARYGVMTPPAVVIDGTVVHAGSLPTPDMIRAWLRKE